MHERAAIGGGPAGIAISSSEPESSDPGGGPAGISISSSEPSSLDSSPASPPNDANGTG